MQRFAFRFAALATAVLLSTPVAAQSASNTQSNSKDSSSASSPAATAKGFGSEIVVTAALEAQTESESTATTDVIDSSEIQARQAATVVDLLRTVPGLDVVQSGGPGQQASLFTRGTRSNHTLVLWNGIELNDPYFGGFNWGFLPTDGIERIEVVRGPFSALYGSEALGGVVQIVTAKQEGLEAQIEGGNQGYRRVAAIAGADLGSLHFEATGHVRRGDGGFANSAYASDELMARSTWAVREDLRLGLVVRANRSDTGIPFAGGAPDLNRHITWSESELALPFNAKLPTDWNLSGNVSKVSYSTRYRDPDDPFGYTASRTDSNAWRARAVASRDLESGWLAVGAEWRQVRVDDGSVFGPTLTDAGQSTWATFAEWVRTIGAARADLGVRRDQNSVYGGHTSPKFGFAWMLGERARVHVSWAEGFRAPSVGELYFAGSGNPNLKPEISRGWEVGFQRRGDHWQLHLTGFQSRLTDLIDFDFARFTNVNVGKATSRGVEFTTGWRRGIVRLEVNTTWTDARDDLSGDPLLRRAEWKGNVIVTARPADWTLNMTVSAVGSRPDVDPSTFVRTRNPGYTRVDFAVRWNRWQHLAPYARIENVADTHYAQALGFPAPGRRFIGGFRLNR